MLLAYIDEIGETGAFVARDHARFNTSPAFGYAGFIIPADSARQFGARFTEEKRKLFRSEVERAEHPGRWERKGSDIFRPQTLSRYPQQIRVVNSLIGVIRRLDGCLFYYADEKPLGTPGQTSLNADARETVAMRETLNRIATHAESRDSNVMVVIDQVNEKTRAARLPIMYGHVLGRAAEHQEMRRIIEPPMHVDSVLSSNIQFADWIAACLTRAIEYQLLESSAFEWVVRCKELGKLRGSFTSESKLHLWRRSADDMHHQQILDLPRKLYPDGALYGHTDPENWRKMKAMSERRHPR